MYEKIWRLKEKLNDISGGDDNARFVVMGDLNTMGRQESDSHPTAISEEQEIENLREDAQSHGMQIRPKTHDETWRGRPRGFPHIIESNLDHVLATDNVSFQSLPEQDTAEVLVSGWHGLTEDDRERFINDLSDHCALFCKVICQESENPT